MTITASTKLSDADVKKMVSDAKEFEDQDKARKEEIESRNTADSLVYTAGKNQDRPRRQTGRNPDRTVKQCNNRR